MPPRKTEALITRSIIILHEFIPLVKSTLVRTVDGIVIETVLLNYTIISLKLYLKGLMFRDSRLKTSSIGYQS